MIKAKCNGLMVVCTILLVLTSSAIGEETAADVQLGPRLAQSAYFAGEEVELAYQAVAPEPIQGTVRWQYAAAERTLARGETAVKSEGNEPVEVAIALQLPPVREGIVFPTELTVTLHDAQENLVAESQQTLWLFSRDPFVERRQWLTDLNIAVYDPAGETAAIFEEAEIPFKKITNPEALETLDRGILIIGEGVSLRTRRGLADRMTLLADRGISVLCLAPSDGEFPWPSGPDQPRPRSLSLRGAEVIQTMDKRLDARLSTIDAAPFLSGLEVVSFRGSVNLKVSDSPQAWPWCHIEYPSGGVCIICGFGLMEHWNTGPTPRFLLARLLEQFEPESPLSSEEQ